MILSKIYNLLSITLLLSACTRYAVGFSNLQQRLHSGDCILRAETESSESSAATIEKSDTSDDFDTILRSRRTINSFLSDLPRDWEETLETAIESAIYAPNHKRTEPWKFHILGPEAIRKVCELNASIVTEKKGEKAGQKKTRAMAANAGLVGSHLHHRRRQKHGRASGYRARGLCGGVLRCSKFVPLPAQCWHGYQMDDGSRQFR